MDVAVTHDGTLESFTGVTSIRVRAGDGTDAIQLLSAITVDAEIDGQAGEDTLTGPDADADWIINGAGVGTIGLQIAFSNVEGIAGGSGSDTFWMNAAFGGTIDGGGGSDTIDYSAYTTSVAVDLSGTATDTGGITSIEKVVGGSAADTLTGGAGNDTYVLEPTGTDTIVETAGGGSDTLDYSAFTNALVVDLNGTTAPNTSAGSSIAYIENVIGGSGNDTLKGDENDNILAGGLGDNTLSGGAGNDTYVLDPSGTATIVEPDGGGSDTLDYSNYTDSVTVDLPNHTAPGTNSGSNIGNIQNITGGAGDDVLIGDSGPNRLTGGPGNDILKGGAGNDFYIVTADSGTDAIIELAGEGTDTIIGPDGDFDWVINGGDSGVLTGDSTFQGIEQLQGGSGDDNFKFEVGGSISGYTSGGGNVEGDSIIAANQANNWQITGANAGSLNGNLFLQVENLIGGNLDDTFAMQPGGSISGLVNGGPDNGDPALENPPVDTVDYSALAGPITVADNVVLQTVDNDIVFRSRLFGIAELEAMIPLGFGTNREVDITIGANTQLIANEINIFAQAEDKSLNDWIGAPKEVDNFVITPLLDKVSELLALPVKVLVKNSTANISFGAGAQLHAVGAIGIYATAVADATGIASGSLFSIGYSQAKAHADITIASGVVIESGEAIVITSTGEAKAEMKAATKRKIDGTPNPGGNSAQIAIALGVSYADSYSHVTVAEGASITAGRAANVTAKGKVESTAETESGMFSNGAAGLAFGLEFSNADIKTNAADTITLKKHSAVFNPFELGQAVVYHAGDGCSIEGLTDGATYYIIASVAELDLQGDSRFGDTDIVRLAETENEARAGVSIDLGAVTGDDFTLAAKHVLDSDFATGVGVVAKLEAETKASAEAGLKSEDTGEPSKWEKFTEAMETNLADKIFQKLTENYKNNSNKSKTEASGSLSVAGALAFSFGNHDVATDIQDTAVLKSNEDLEVKATIQQKYNLSAESSTEAQEGGPSAPNSVSVAVSVGVLNNSAKATVHGGAQLDALRALRVIAEVTYPILQELDTYVPLSWSELTDSLRTDGVKALTKYIDNTLGFKDAFFNTWTAASASSEKIGIAGSVSVLVLTSDAEAIVRGGAKLNQDAAWRNDALNPHPNQDNAPGIDSDGAENEQTVSVESLVAQQMITMTGIFSLPDLPSIDPTDKNKTKKNFSKFGTTLKDPTGTAGTGGQRGGAGGSIFINVTNDTSHAIVEDDAQVYNGADGGFDIKARELQLNVNLAQAYAKGGTLAIGGTVLYNGQTTDTLAQLGATAVVTGRNVNVIATDDSTLATWAAASPRARPSDWASPSPLTTSTAAPRP